MGKPRKSRQEQGWRNRARELLLDDGVMRGSISVRLRVCGKAGCRCATELRHRALFVTYRREGQTTQLYVPKEFEARVRQWVRRYGEVQELLENLSGLYEAKVRQRKD